MIFLLHACAVFGCIKADVMEQIAERSNVIPSDLHDIDT